MHRVAAVHHEGLDCQEELRPGKTFVYTAGTAMARFLAEIEPVLIPHVGDEILQQLPAELDSPAARLVLKGSSVLLVHLVAHGGALGFLVFGRKPDRPAFVAADLAACEEVAERAAVALHNARIHSDEATASAVLQRSLLPTPPPRLPGVEIAYRYHPSSRTTQVGGDWFDVIPLPGHRVGLAIGDVAGHGLHAAVVMGQLRTAVRTLATLDLPRGGYWPVSTPSHSTWATHSWPPACTASTTRRPAAPPSPAPAICRQSSWGPTAAMNC